MFEQAEGPLIYEISLSEIGSEIEIEIALLGPESSQTLSLLHQV